MLTWRKLTICAVNFCFEAGGERLVYFYDYFVKEYREGRGNGLLHAPADMFQSVRQEDVQNCRKALKNAFVGYRCGRGDVKALEKLLGEYREYITCCHDGHAKDRYNAFVYRYMAEAHVGMKAAAAKLGVVKETVFNYIDRDIDEMLVMCMGAPAAGRPESGEDAVRMLTGCSRIFHNMAGGYVPTLFTGKNEKAAVEQGRRITGNVMEQMDEAVKAYCGYCRDEYFRIDTDIRKAGILERCLAGIPVAAIAEEYGCSEGTVYADIRENEKRLSAMLFGSAKAVVTDGK